MTIEEKLNVILNKPADEWPLYMPYEGTIEEQVYETLTGNLIPAYRVPCVENIFVSGHPCFEAYSDMCKAYERLLARLDIQDEDGDVKIIVDSLLEYGKIIALEMFRYGKTYKKCKSIDGPTLYTIL